MEDKWAIADFRLSYMKEERFDILASSIERCLHSLGIKDLQVTCGIVEKDRLGIGMVRAENKEDAFKLLRKIYGKHTL